MVKLELNHRFYKGILIKTTWILSKRCCRRKN